jgi:hypothetical protein
MTASLTTRVGRRKRRFPTGDGCSWTWRGGAGSRPSSHRETGVRNRSVPGEHTGWKPVPHVLPHADNPLGAWLVRAAFRGGDDCTGGALCPYDLGCNGLTARRAHTTWIATDRRRAVPVRPGLQRTDGVPCPHDLGCDGPAARRALTTPSAGMTWIATSRSTRCTSGSCSRCSAPANPRATCVRAPSRRGPRLATAGLRGRTPHHRPAEPDFAFLTRDTNSPYLDAQPPPAPGWPLTGRIVLGMALRSNGFRVEKRGV